MSRSASASDQAATLALEIRSVFRQLRRHLRDQAGRSDLTPSQISVVLRLERDGAATVSSLARAEGMRPQSMSSVVAPLQQADLIRGAADPSDGRQTLMHLTPKCLKLLKHTRAAKQDWLTGRISQTLSAKQQKKLRASLNLLQLLIDKTED